MVKIQQDSREREGAHEHVLEYFKSVGINVIRNKLYLGDYTLLHKQDIVIDTKQDMLEIFGNLTHDHERFRAECIRAKENGIKLYILVEEPLPAGGLSNWVSPIWKSTTENHVKGEPKTKANPATMEKIMNSMSNKYGVSFCFCSKENTGRYILKLLGVEI